MMTKAMEALNDLVGIHVCAFPPGVETICGFTIHDLDKKHNLILAALEENKKLKAEIELVNDNYGQLRNETNKEFAKLKAELEKYKISYEQLKKINKLKESEWMLKIHCCMCEEELQRPGGLIMSPPQTKHQYVEKGHLCFECYWRVLFFINGKEGEDNAKNSKAV